MDSSSLASIEAEWPRVDVLLYAHDGCGFGHASRVVALALALRRRSPQLRVLVVTGLDNLVELAAGAPLDWIKLPSYRTEIKNGVARTTVGYGGLSPVATSYVRAQMLRQIVAMLAPRCLVVDFLPSGKRNELADALTEAKRLGTRCVLALRAVIGQVDAFWSDEARSTFRRHYAAAIWFGDPELHGANERKTIERHLGCSAVAVGLASRALEIERVAPITPLPAYGMVAMSWCDPTTAELGERVARAIAINEATGQWNVYIGPSRAETTREKVTRHFQALRNCLVNPFSHHYLGSIRGAAVAVAYGGYNTITDLVWSRTPALVFARSMADAEQVQHLRLLGARLNDSIKVMPQAVEADVLAGVLHELAERPRNAATIDLDGAARAARFIAELVP